MLDEDCCSSFVGRWKIPVRYSCTVGELAAYFRVIKMPGLELIVFPVSNWRRKVSSAKRFVPTSPAISKLSSAMLYPGMGLLEGINVNEGRDTGFAFEMCGAPWIDGHELAEAFYGSGLEGINASPVSYVARNGLHVGQTCHGIKLSIHDESKFLPVKMGISLIHTLINLYPQHISERLYRTLANPGGTGHLDKLLGIANAFYKIGNNKKIITDVAMQWKTEVDDYLLY
jgi:uncharacterized protein YbbC (DUF1343 family)